MIISTGALKPAIYFPSLLIRDYLRNLPLSVEAEGHGASILDPTCLGWGLYSVVSELESQWLQTNSTGCMTHTLLKARFLSSDASKPQWSWDDMYAYIPFRSLNFRKPHTCWYILFSYYSTAGKILDFLHVDWRVTSLKYKGKERRIAVHRGLSTGRRLRSSLCYNFSPTVREDKGLETPPLPYLTYSALIRVHRGEVWNEVQRVPSPPPHTSQYALPLSVSLSVWGTLVCW